MTARDSDAPADLARRATAEALVTAMLVAAVVGSGVMGERLSGGNVALALLANGVATGAALVALILTFGPVSGVHFNSAVTLASASQRGLRWRDAAGYLAAQFAGAAAAAILFRRLAPSLQRDADEAVTPHARGAKD